MRETVETGDEVDEEEEIFTQRGGEEEKEIKENREREMG